MSQTTKYPRRPKPTGPMNVLADSLPLENVAGITRTLAVLLGGGLNPPSAWKHTSDAYALYPRQFRAACGAAKAGRDIAAAILGSDFDCLRRDERQAWLALASAWWLGSRSGVNMANSLLSISKAFSEIAAIQREIKVALSAPAATAKMVAFLPLLSVAIGFALGFNPLSTLLFSLPGFICLILGSGLVYVSRRWNKSMLAKANPGDTAPGLEYELCVISVSGGRAINLAWEQVQEAMHKFALPIRHTERVQQLIALSFASGAPATGLLQAEAELARLQARTTAQQAVQRLAVRLMLPLGLCILPAFMLIGVVPLVMSIMGDGMF